MSRIRFIVALLVALFIAIPATAAETPLVEGTHYARIAGGQPFRAERGKIEVVEVFSYQCGHCKNFEPAMTVFASKLPKDVVVRYVPASFASDWEPYARAYETARLLGVDKRSHAAVFKALHEERSLPRTRPSAEEIATFYQRYGVAPSKFVATYNSDKVTQLLAANDAFILKSNVQGTPTMIVNGQFMPLGHSLAEVLRNTGHLIRQVRNGTVR